MAKWFPGKKITSWLDNLTGAASNREAKNEREFRQQQYEEAQQAWNNVSDEAPDWHELFPSTVERESDEVYRNPDRYFAESTSDKWRADEDFIKAQKQALSGQLGAARQFQDIYNQGGLDAQTRAENAAMAEQYQMQERAGRQSILQQMAERGLGGSGSELASALANQQGSANAQYQGSLANLASGQMRAQNALAQSGQLYGQYGQAAAYGRGQSFGEAATRGQATDQFNMYNTQFRRDIHQRDIDRLNTWYGQIADARQRGWENQYRVAAGRTGQATAAAGQAGSNAAAYQQQANQGAQATAGIIGTAIKAAAS